MSDYTVVIHYQTPEPQNVEALHGFILAILVAHADASVRVTVIEGGPAATFGEDGADFELEDVEG